jgi:hypothetical protein
LENAKKYYPCGRIDGDTAMMNANSVVPEAQRAEDDAHALSLLHDLINKGLAEVKYAKRKNGERQAPKHFLLKITAKGSSLLNETVPVDPDIEDDRAVDED